MGIKVRDMLRRAGRSVMKDANVSRASRATGDRVAPWSRGGLVNPTTGQGVAGPDKQAGTWFTPTIFGSRVVLDAIYGESWAAEKIIDIIPDDIWARGRRWIIDSETDREAWIDCQKRWGIQQRIRLMHKAARLYGSAMLAVITDDDLTEEWSADDHRPGTLRNLLPMDRYDTEVVANYLDPKDPHYGEPSMYRYTPRIRATRGPTGPAAAPVGGHSLPFEIHASRVFRMDGRKPPATAGWEGYEPWWGLSILVRALADIGREMTTASAGAQMAEEASIPVIKGQGIRAAIRAAQRGGQSFDDPSLTEIMETISHTKSVYRTMILDENDEFLRVNVQFSGFSDVLDKYPERLAFIAGIPITRFLARSPAGMSATGESDRAHYATEVEAQRDRQVQDVVDGVDAVLAADEGMAEVPEHEWPSLYEASDKERAEVLKTEVETIATMVSAGAISEETAADLIRALDEKYGDIPDAPDLPDPEPMPVLPGPMDPAGLEDPDDPEPPDPGAAVQ